MLDNGVDFGLWLFTSLVLVLSAMLTSYLMHGTSSRKSRECFVGLILTIMISYQLYMLLMTSQFIPAYPEYTYDSSLLRSQCRNSDKGGKRPGSRALAFDFNPCFCHAGANCIDSKSGAVLSNDNTCPTDGSAICYDPTNAVYIDLYNNNERNCKGGQGTEWYVVALIFFTINMFRH
jgi:hypothetical protein